MMILRHKKYEVVLKTDLRLFRPYQNVLLSVIDYGLGLTTLPQSNLLKLDMVQIEAMRVIQGPAKDTLIEAMCYLLDLPSVETRYKVLQVKVYLNGMQNPGNPLHNAVKEEKGLHWHEASHEWAKRNSHPECVQPRIAQASTGLGKLQ